MTPATVADGMRNVAKAGSGGQPAMRMDRLRAASARRSAL